MSFNPLYEQIELECAGAPVRTPEPENATSGTPGRPVTSPAKAGLALNPAMATTHAAAASFDLSSMAFSLLMAPAHATEAPSQAREQAVKAVRPATQICADPRTTRRDNIPIRHRTPAAISHTPLRCAQQGVLAERRT